MAFTRNMIHSVGSETANRCIRSRSERLRAYLRSGEEGQSVLELALVLPALLFVLTGMLAFGVYFNNYLTLTEAVGMGGTYLQQIRLTTTDPCADTFTAIRNAAPNLVSTSIGQSISINGGSPITGTSCTGSVTALQGAQGEPVKVTATYPCSLIIMSINFAGSTCTLTASMTEFEY